MRNPGIDVHVLIVELTKFVLHILLGQQNRVQSAAFDGDDPIDDFCHLILDFVVLLTARLTGNGK